MNFDVTEVWEDFGVSSVEAVANSVSWYQKRMKRKILETFKQTNKQTRSFIG